MVQKSTSTNSYQYKDCLQVKVFIYERKLSQIQATFCYYYVGILWVADILCWMRAMFTWREKNRPRRERTPSHPLNMSGWVGVQKVSDPHPPLNILHHSHVGQGVVGSLKLFASHLPLNILHHQFMLARGWLGIQNFFGSLLLEYLTSLSHAGEGVGGGTKISDPKNWTMVHVWKGVDTVIWS